MSLFIKPRSFANRIRNQVKLCTAGVSVVLAITLTSLTAFPANSQYGISAIPVVDHSNSHAKSIILFIGDGMGAEQRKAGRWASVGQSGQLAMDTLPYQGWLQTASADNPVTDSAAGATAMATGVKTDNGHIGVDPTEAILETILEIAEGRDLASGLVTTVEISHATPAAFAAHVPNRNMMVEIALQMIESGVEVLLGGGEDEFLPPAETGCYIGAGERSDGRNLIAEAQASGFTYVCDGAGLAAVNTLTTDQLLGLFAGAEMERPYSPTLVEMTQAALEILERDPQGFFLMVEGGRIDKAGHDNDGAYVIEDVIGFDEALQVGLDYAALHPDTLVIVAADHETGGMSVSLTPGDQPFAMPDETPFYISFSTTNHTATNVPVSAIGPWSSFLQGTLQNTEVFFTMRKALDWWVWLPLVQK